MCLCVCVIVTTLPCPQAAITHHICCSGIWSLSASWSETTSMPAVIYHREMGCVVCECVYCLCLRGNDAARKSKMSKSWWVLAEKAVDETRGTEGRQRLLCLLKSIILQVDTDFSQAPIRKRLCLLSATASAPAKRPQFTTHHTHTQALSGKPNLQLLIW